MQITNWKDFMCSKMNVLRYIISRNFDLEEPFIYAIQLNVWGDTLHGSVTISLQVVTKKFYLIDCFSRWRQFFLEESNSKNNFRIWIIGKEIHEF
jgi:hypothetical protein